jgi:hypothetical protein
MGVKLTEARAITPNKGVYADEQRSEQRGLVSFIGAVRCRNGSATQDPCVFIRPRQKDRVERAIADELAFLAANPTRIR